MAKMLAAICLAVCLLVSMSGCHSYTVKSGAAQSGPTQSKIGVQFVFGLIGAEATAPDCAKGVAWVKTVQPWWSFFVGGITFGLITPWKAEWACS